MSKKVYQYDINNGNLLIEFRTTTKAANSIDVAESNLRQKLNQQDPLNYKGYIWSRIKNSRIDVFNEQVKKGKLLDIQPINNIAKILLFDIETSPMMVYAWKLYKNTASIDQIAKDWTVLTWAAKWLGEDEIISETQMNYRSIQNPYDLDDFEIVEKLWHLFDEADFVVAHNGRVFDTKKINAKFIEHGMSPPSPYKVIDTLDIAKRNFNFTSNKLDYIAQNLGVGAKMEHEGFKLWEKCMWGDEEAWKIMLDYNIQDIKILESVYLQLRMFDSRHPSVSIYNPDENEACTKCGSKNITYIKDTYTNTRVYKLYKCGDCNGWSRGRTGVNKKNVLMIK